MAKGSSKSTVLKNAQRVAAATSMDSVAINAGKYDAKNRTKQSEVKPAKPASPAHSKKPEKKMSAAKKALVVCVAAMVVVFGLPRLRRPVRNLFRRRPCLMVRLTYPA